MISNFKVNNPCVSNCCLDEQDTCLGCFRTLDEILGWHSMSDEQKTGTLKRCQVRQQQKYDKTNLHQFKK
ncbi:DUF1289 domain-containing protein [Psychrobium sp. 1_MG-2023]|uniref:DUF1289 domain-containing protein n=1 Tax=Psychrobium sp. 1_MG-2023 TaxID=3062624 RepID=UPI000C32F858|nr:DUF1289 domain-containing protein [Psychrobium sp. 1_MG-2023]MDP2560461.1 DUF1289 domain-containing protein [Psychrobium sp. 1_MG-2023]PKF57879.1 DUF1289 domain-containing protein [Alteromonadales bacterium alter-6D02]